jgi:hypothetical protein
MKHVDFKTFIEQRHAYDACVRQTPSVDRFCSSSYWIVPALEALFSDHDPWIRRTDDGSGWVPLARGYHEAIGHYLQPMEASWGLASPVVGDDPQAVVGELVDEVRRAKRDGDSAWDMLFLSGVFEGSPLFEAIIRQFRREYVVGVGPTMGRHVASLEGGFEDWLENRSSKFRHNLRRARRQADEAGVDFEYHRVAGDETASWSDHLSRIRALERESWKGREGSGIATGPMYTFYRRMIPMLAEDEALRVSYVTLDGVDIAYCFGGVLGDLYRGLQLSYHDDYGDLSPGNLAQWVMLEGLADEGIATYDMGQSMDYKERWSDREETSVALIIR